jgi:MFS family permease
VTAGGGRAAWIALLVQGGLLTGSVALLRPAISYSALDLGVAPEWLGPIAASFALIPVLVALPLGHLTDRRGTRGTMLAGAGLMVISTVLLATVGGTLPGLLAANVLLGFGQIIVMMCLQSGVALLWPPERRNSAYGWFAFATAIGQMVGPGVLALIGGSDLTPETLPVYLVGAAAGIVMAGCAVAWALRVPPHGSAATQDAPLRWRAAFRVPGLASATLTSLTVLAAIDLLGVYLPALGVEYGIPAGAIGLLLMVRAGASTLSRALMGMLLRAIGERALLIGSLAIACVSIALVPVPLPLPALVALMALAGIGLGYAHPLTLAWVANAAPEQVRGAAIAVRLLGNRIGQTVLPAAAGVLTLSAGTGVVFWAIAATLGGVTVLSARARPGREKKSP